MMGRALLAWLLLMMLAVANGTFRVKLLVPVLGEWWAHVASTLLLCAIILATTWFIHDWLHAGTQRDALVVGFLWFILTIAFEFGFGRLVARKPWAELLADYNVAAGRIWLLVLLTTLIAPALTCSGSWSSTCLPVVIM